MPNYRVNMCVTYYNYSYNYNHSYNYNYFYHYYYFHYYHYFHYCYCYAPKEIYKSNKLANAVYNSSEGLSTPVTSPLMSPKPARTGRRLYSWRNSGKREVCMYVRILDPLEFRNNHKKESEDKFNAECSEGGKDVTSSSHSNRKSSKSSKSMTVSNSGKNGINSYNNKYHEIKIKNNSASKGRQGEE